MSLCSCYSFSDESEDCPSIYIWVFFDSMLLNDHIEAVGMPHSVITT